MQAQPVVDIHCHVFNADDIPVRGFVDHVVLKSNLGHLLGKLVDKIVQDDAPGFTEDMTRITNLLAATDAEYGGLAVGDAQREQANALVEAANAADLTSQLIESDPEFVQELASALREELWPADLAQSDPVSMDSLSFGDLSRAVRWAKLFSKSRITIATNLVHSTVGNVALFCPLLVDMDLGLHDRAETTVAEQVALMEGVSILSMRSRLPGVRESRLHPFIGFDPRRHMHEMLDGARETPLEIVQSAVMDHGFIGVKLYPPMGWRPLGNVAGPNMSAAQAKLINEELERFYSWCVAEAVPVTTHANRTNTSAHASKEHAGPEGWRDVLARYPALRLNLGHFGGDRFKSKHAAWSEDFARLAEENENVYVDVSNHRIYDPRVASQYIDWLADRAADPATSSILTRVMYGSDWLMSALHPQHELFLSQYRDLYSARFDPDQTRRFLGGNALSFLGFDKADNHNATRLASFYRRHAPSQMPEWLATPV